MKRFLVLTGVGVAFLSAAALSQVAQQQSAPTGPGHATRETKSADLFGTDMGPPMPRQSWATFRSTVPLTDEEFKTIAANVAPYLRCPPPDDNRVGRTTSQATGAPASAS